MHRASSRLLDQVAADHSDSKREAPVDCSFPSYEQPEESRADILAA